MRNKKMNFIHVRYRLSTYMPSSTVPIHLFIVKFQGIIETLWFTSKKPPPKLCIYIHNSSAISHVRVCLFFKYFNRIRKKKNSLLCYINTSERRTAGESINVYRHRKLYIWLLFGYTQTNNAMILYLYVYREQRVYSSNTVIDLQLHCGELELTTTDALERLMNKKRWEAHPAKEKNFFYFFYLKKKYSNQLFL